MNIRELYNDVSNNLDKIDFNLLWTGFHLYTFALYDQHKVYFKDKEISVDDRFIGNTTINFEGETIAIWNISNQQEVDLDIFTANIVHEMFHCYQKDCKDIRYANDLILLDYPDNLKNYSMKYQENIELVKGIESKNSFNKFVTIRKCRTNLIGQIIEQEFLTETMEGLAEYISTMALKQLSFEKYNKRISEYSRIITSLNEIQFDIRRISYYIGTLFYIALFNNGYELNKNLSDTNSFFNQLIYKYTFVVNYEEISTNEELVNKFNKYISNKENQITNFLSTHLNEIKYNSFICGYDPMNMIKINNMILSTRFIYLKSIDNESSKIIKQPVLLKMKNDSTNIVYSYIM